MMLDPFWSEDPESNPRLMTLRVRRLTAAIVEGSR